MKKKEVELVKVTETSIKQYTIALKEENYSNHTIARKTSALRMYFKYLRKSGVMLGNPLEDIKQPELRKREIELNKSDIDDLMTYVCQQKNKRDQLIFYFVCFEKIKWTQIVSLKTKNYQKGHGILYLENQAIVLSEITKQFLEQYIEEYETETEYLFLNQYQKPLTQAGMYYLIKKCLLEAGMENVRPIDLCLGL